MRYCFIYVICYLYIFTYNGVQKQFPYLMMFVTFTVSRRASLVEQELLNIPWVHLRFLVGFVLLDLRFSLYCFVDDCLFFCSSFGHCIVWPSSFGYCIVCPSSFVHCIVCPSSIYASRCFFGIVKLFLCLL